MRPSRSIAMEEGKDAVKPLCWSRTMAMGSPSGAEPLIVKTRMPNQGKKSAQAAADLGLAIHDIGFVMACAALRDSWVLEIREKRGGIPCPDRC